MDEKQPMVKKRSIGNILLIVICLIAKNVQANQAWEKSIETLIFQGQYDRAVEALTKIKQTFDPTSKNYVQAIVMQANALKAMGRHQLALDLLLPIVPIIVQCPPEISVRFYNTLGNIHAFFYEYRKAAQKFERSMQIAKKAQSQVLICQTLNEMGLLYSIHANNEKYARKAIQAFTRAIQYARQIQEHENHFLAQLMVNIAKVYARNSIQQDSNLKKTSLTHAYRYLSSLSDSYRKGCLLLDIAGLYAYHRLSDNAAEEYKIYNEVRRINDSIHDNRLESLLNLRMGELYEQANQYNDAITLTQKSVFYAQLIPAAHILYLANWQLGRLYRKTGHIKKAITHYGNAMEHLTPIRQQIYHSDLTQKNVFERKIKPVYLELSEIYFNLAASEAGQLSPQFYTNSIKNVWKTMDKVKSAELEDIFDDPCVAYQKDDKLQLDRPLDSTGVIYFIPFPGQPGLIIKLPDGFKHHRLNIQTEVFNKTIYRLRDEIPNWGLFESDAMQLYELIIAPIYNDLKKQNVQTLVIASDGAMRMLPFSLFLNAEERFLIEEFSIVTIPALHLTRIGQTNRNTPNGLFCGITKERIMGNLKFDALPRITEEIKAIASVVPGDIYLDEDFTVSTLKDNIAEKRYSIVHMATHGEFGSIPEKTFLVTHDGHLTMNSLEKLITQTRSSAIDLLTLSACQTAIGDERAAFGLAGVAVKAGAKCAIATLWSVDDYASKQIISGFYSNVYQKNFSKAEALQKAQLSLIEKIQFWHPAVWSAFLVIGNWY